LLSAPQYIVYFDNVQKTINLETKLKYIVL